MMNGKQNYFTLKWLESPLIVKKSFSSVIILNDKNGLGNYIGKVLKEKGVNVINVTYGGFYQRIGNSYVITGSEEDFYSIFKNAGVNNITRILHLWMLDIESFLIDNSVQLEYSQHIGAYSMFNMVKAISLFDYDNKLNIDIVAYNTSAVTGNEKYLIPEE